MKLLLKLILRLQNAAGCASDCNFGLYLGFLPATVTIGASQTTINASMFITALLPNLPGNVAPNCKNTLPNNLMPLPPTSNTISSDDIRQNILGKYWKQT